MGKGDKKSKRGKIILGSFGVRRRKKARAGHPAGHNRGARGRIPAARPSMAARAARPRSCM